MIVMAVARSRTPFKGLLYISITRASNAFTVWASNDPEGEAGGHNAPRYCLSQFSRTPGGLGRASALFNGMTKGVG